MKIGILTFHKSINYGSVLQVFALLHQLNALGHTVEVIDYEPQKHQELYCLYQKVTSVRSFLVNLLRRFPARTAYANRKEAFRAFSEKYLCVSKEKYYYASDFSKLSANYDAIICGSDQIWNVHAKDCDDIYFLPVAKKCRKIAYAVSLNDTDFTEARCNDTLRQWISDFDAISVRERGSCGMLETFLKGAKPVFHALDPTFLLSKSIFRNIAHSRFLQKPYIFMFSVTFSPDMIRAAALFSQKTGLPVYTLLSGSSSYRFLRKHPFIKILPTHLSPEDFLRYMDDAEFVFSNSFHGTAFSIIFEKKFFAINDRRKDGSLKNDARLTHILDQFGLSDRLVSVEDIPSLSLSADIDYAKVNERKAVLVNNSMAFLTDALNSGELS